MKFNKKQKQGILFITAIAVILFVISSNLPLSIVSEEANCERRWISIDGDVYTLRCDFHLHEEHCDTPYVINFNENDPKFISMTNWISKTSYCRIASSSGTSARFECNIPLEYDYHCQSGSNFALHTYTTFEANLDYNACYKNKHYYGIGEKYCYYDDILECTGKDTTTVFEACGVNQDCENAVCVDLPPEEECTSALDCEGKYHVAVPGHWECQSNSCVWVEDVVGGCESVEPDLQDDCCKNLGYDYWDGENCVDAIPPEPEPPKSYLVPIIIVSSIGIIIFLLFQFNIIKLKGGRNG